MDIADLIPDPANRRTHDARNLGMVTDALKHVGAARSIVIDEDNVILAGNGVSAAAAQAGITTVRVVDATGDELVAVRRSGLTVEQKRALAIYDNRTAELAAWNFEQLAADQAAGLNLQPFWTPDEEAALLPTGSDAIAAIQSLVSDTGRPIVQMTFTVTEAQAVRVNRVLALAKAAGDFDDSGNANSNGNALARI